MSLLCIFGSHQTRAQSSTACSGVSESPKYVRSSKSCQSFYYCNPRKGIAIPRTCQNNYVFNARTQSCENATKVDCAVCSAWGIQRLAHPSQFNSFYWCLHGIRFDMNCEDGTTFDPESGECSERLTKKSICDGINDEITIGDPKDCS